MRRGPDLELIDALYGIPEAVQALRRLNEANAPEWAQEVKRATRWVHERLPRGPEGFDPGQWTDIPPWVRLQLLDTWARWWQGKTETCLHTPHPARPEPVAAALWRPGLVSCLSCSSDLFRLTGEADRTCDGCGRVVAGLEAGDGIHPSGVTFGPLLLFWGACGDCKPHPRTPQSRPNRKRKRNGKR